MSPSRLQRSLCAAVLTSFALVTAHAVPCTSLSVAHAQNTPAGAPVREVSGEIFIVLASERGGEMDPSLAAIPALRQPPFNAFSSMQLLARPAIRLTVGEPTMVPLPNGRVLQIVLDSVTPQGRYRVRVSINRPEQHDYLPLLEVVAPPGDPFFLAGQNFLGGTLILGVRLGERAAR